MRLLSKRSKRVTNPKISLVKSPLPPFSKGDALFQRGGKLVGRGVNIFPTAE